MEISLENWCLDIGHLTLPLQDEVKVFITASTISHLLEDPGYRSGVDPVRQPSDLSWSYAAIAVSSRNALSQVSWEGALCNETKIAAMETWGSYYLHRKTGNSSWKIKWFAPFRLASFRK